MTTLLEKIEEKVKRLNDDLNYYRRNDLEYGDIDDEIWFLKTIYRELKALEIIVKKDIHIKVLMTWIKTYKGKLTYQEYLGILQDCDLGETLTQEEYNLLKKILL